MHDQTDFSKHLCRANPASPTCVASRTSIPRVHECDVGAVYPGAQDDQHSPRTWVGIPSKQPKPQHFPTTKPQHFPRAWSRRELPAGHEIVFPAFPAYVDETPSIHPTHRVHTSIPRVRGRDTKPDWDQKVYYQHSPRTLARHTMVTIGPSGSPAFPAYVGETPGSRLQQDRAASIPRVRRRDGGLYSGAVLGSQHSPRTWARHGMAQSARRLLPAFPAYVGSTGPIAREPPETTSIPRVRGLDTSP